jgi:Ca2+-binding RTX toxin-like protein
MARLTSGGLLAVDNVNLRISDVAYLNPVVANGGLIAFESGSDRIEFHGSGFGVTASFVATGTVTGILQLSNSQTVLAISGLSLPLSTLDNWVSFGQDATARTTLFAGADEIVGSAAADWLAGYAGNDYIRGGAGADTLDGGAGNDTLDGGEGNDSMAGGLGDDTYVVDSVDDIVAEGPSEGLDTVLSFANFTLPDHIENLTIYNAAISATGNATGNAILGNAISNVLDGMEGDDLLRGFAGNDILLGRIGNDALYGGAGADAIDGGEGNDYIEGEQGNDGIYGREGNDTILGGDGDDWLFGESDSPVGGGGDLIRGGNGNDYIDGGPGNDVLHGEAGADTILGGLGNDVIVGGPGGDLLSGGAGGDLFVYAAETDFAGGADTITGLDTPYGTNDGFDLRALFVNAPGSDAAAMRSAGWLRVTQSGADALLQYDRDGGGDAYVTIARLVAIDATLVADYMLWVK